MADTIDRSTWNEYDVINAITELPHPSDEKALAICRSIKNASDHLCMRIHESNVWDDVIMSRGKLNYHGTMTSMSVLRCMSCYDPVRGEMVVAEFRRTLSQSADRTTAEIASGHKMYHKHCTPDIKQCMHVDYPGAPPCGKLCEFDHKLLFTLLKNDDAYQKAITQAEEELYVNPFIFPDLSPLSQPKDDFC